MSDDLEAARRWRLVLGRYADERLSLTGSDAKLESTLSYLYDREYTSRGHRLERGAGGSLDGSNPSALSWLGQARELFPNSTLSECRCRRSRNIS